MTACGQDLRFFMFGYSYMYVAALDTKIMAGFVILTLSEAKSMQRPIHRVPTGGPKQSLSYFPAQKCPFCASIPFQSSAQGGFVGFSIRRWAVHASPTPLSGIAVPVSFRCE
jgi:hypothetical protein